MSPKEPCGGLALVLSMLAASCAPPTTARPPTGVPGQPYGMAPQPWRPPPPGWRPPPPAAGAAATPPSPPPASAFPDSSQIPPSRLDRFPPTGPDADRRLVAHAKWVRSSAWTRKTLRLAPDAPYPRLTPAEQFKLQRIRDIELRGTYLYLWRIGGPLTVDHALHVVDTAGTDEPAARMAIAIPHRHIPRDHPQRPSVQRALNWVSPDLPATQNEALTSLRTEARYCYETLMAGVGAFEADATIALDVAPNGVPEQVAVSIVPAHPGLAVMLEGVALSTIFPRQNDAAPRRLRVEAALRVKK